MEKIREWIELIKEDSLKYLYIMMVILIGCNVLIFADGRISAHLMRDMSSIVMSEEKKRERVCFFGMESIAEKRPVARLFDDNTFKDLMTNLDQLELDAKHYYEPVLKKRICKIVIEDGEGFRVFELELDSNEKYLIGHAIVDVKELDTTNEDMGEYL